MDMHSDVGNEAPRVVVKGREATCEVCGETFTSTAHSAFVFADLHSRRHGVPVKGSDLWDRHRAEKFLKGIG